ncbi:hypothetical protein SDC9_167946 [bioreactor metagenome]|uniref:Uncharacterized protein n=1 Tax=bioreactor metagenome TaxID=1076179 RepID=A0A645G149_9ZZZZ
MAFSDQISRSPVPRMAACAGHNQIAHSAQTDECHRIGTESDSQTTDFRQSARHQSRFCVVAITQSVKRSRTYCDDVLQCSTQLYPDDIRVPVDPEIGIHEQFLHITCILFVLGCGSDRCDVLFGDFFRMARSGKDDQAFVFLCRNLFLDNDRNPFMGILLQTFAGVDQMRPCLAIQ